VKIPDPMVVRSCAVSTEQFRVTFNRSWTVHGTVFLNSSPTGHLLAPLENFKTYLCLLSY